ncbi:hypothetical protein, partial [Turicimonas muris]|uniref:hypothetical protein n=1 Tax=Turicimonas muris TaxID=1796652 RepID=UPI00249473AE
CYSKQTMCRPAKIALNIRAVRISPGFIACFIQVMPDGLARFLTLTAEHNALQLTEAVVFGT